MTGWETGFLAAAAVAMIAFGTLYCCRKQEEEKASLIYKALATSMTVLMSGCYAVRFGGSIAWLICIGTVCCMTADIVLEIHFITGAFIFGIGHLFFIAGFMCEVTPFWDTAIIFAVLYFLFLLIFGRFFKKLKKLAYLGAAYLGVLCVMCSMALTMFIRSGTSYGATAAAGGICFVFSDSILAWCKLSKKRKAIHQAVILLLYYSAVYLIALSLYQMR